MTMSSLDPIFNQFIEQSGKLFALPDIYQKLDQLLQAENSSIKDIGFLISSDAALTAQVLKLANSPAFSFKADISTIDRAINLIGTQELKNLVLMEVIVKNFNNQPCSVINPEDFWRRSSYLAIIAKKVALYTKHSDPDRLFVCGVLHRIGVLIYCSVDPLITQQVNNALLSDNLLALPNSSELSIELSIEQQILGFNYSELSAKLLHYWKVPESIYLPIAYSAFPLSLKDKKLQKNTQLYLEDSFILYFAQLCSFLLEIQESEVLEADQLLEKVDPQIVTALNLNHGFINELLLDIEIDAIELLSAIFPESTSLY